MLASMSMEGMGPSFAVEGATTATVFEAYVEKALAPTLRPEQVVVMDNLSAHKGAGVRKLIEERNCELVYLAALLARSKPYRGGLQQDEGPPS